MKTTLLTIALTAASLPFAFAAQTVPAKPAASSTVASKSTVVKKHSKKSTKKSISKTNDSTGAAAVKK